jgi:serine/threonine protein phosphatase PrpC
MRLTAGGYTNSGPRPLNQDWFYWDVDLGLFVVADGMGGHNAGEVASHLAVETVTGFIEQSREPRDLTWPFGVDPTKSLDANRLGTAVRLANRRVHREGQAHPAFNGMGTTLVALLVSGNHGVLASVGDSRIYRLRGGAVDLLTRDDTWLSALLAAGSPQDTHMRTHPMRHVLTSVIGVNEDVAPTLREEGLEPGDCWLLCTDGVHGHADTAAFAGALKSAPSAEGAAVGLVESALAAGATDNATALVVCVAE